METTPRRVTDLASVLLAPNPGPMTLDGTNTYLLRRGADGPAVVVDPGPDDAGHLAAIAAAGPIELILITHQHHDHTAGAPTLYEMTGAPVRAMLPEHCHGAEPLGAGERIDAAGLTIEVLATPGHSADSVCFLLLGDGPRASVLTGDTVLGRGSTVIGIPDGTLAQYLDSLRLLAGLGAMQVLPAHGPVLDDLSAVCEKYLTHRLERLDQVRRAIADLGLAADPDSEDTVAAVQRAVYGDIDPAVAFAAAFSVATQLAYLADEHR